MTGKNTLKYIPLFIILCIIPFLVQIVVTDSGLSGYDWFSKNGTEYDFFLIYKMYGIIITAIIMFVMLITCLYRDKHIDGMILISLLLYTVLSVLSAVFAHNPKDAFFGGYAQHEPVTVIVSYVIIFIYTYCVLDDGKAVITFVKIVVPGAFVMSLIGALQWFGADFFTSYAGKSLISVFSSINPSQISSSFGEGRVYMTLYNPNYTGVYTALMFPMCLAGIFAIKNIWFRIVSAVTAIMLVMCVAGSQSEAGAYALIITVTVFVLVCIYIRNKKAGHILLCTIIIATAAVSAYVGINSIEHDNSYPLEYMDVTEEGVDICINGKKLHVKSSITGQDTDISLYDDNMNVIELSESGDTYTVKYPDTEYAGLYFKTGVSEEGMRGFDIICGNVVLFFTNDNESGKYYYRNVYGKYTDDIGSSENAVLKLKDNLASHRGYIWSETIPLLSDNILIGCGSDNFIYEFPNNDYLSLINNGYSGAVVTRPHNMYLQTAVQTGILSLIVFLFLYAVYFIRSIRIIRNIKTVSGVEFICISVFAGSIGYMVCGLSNDSSVCTAPLFWVILAAGFCCNNIIKKGEL